jgi:arginyl-tRNA synthetase
VRRKDNSLLLINICFQLFPELGLVAAVKETAHPKYGDYQFDQAPAIVQKLAAHPPGVKKNANAVARAVFGELPKNDLIGEVPLFSIFSFFRLSYFSKKALKIIFHSG